MKHPSARALHAYWERLRGTRAAPERAEIEPAKIGRLLGDIFLLELGTSPRFAVRLAGTRLCALMGQEIRARGLGELFAPEDRPALFGALEGVADDALPLVSGITGETADDRAVELEMIVLPLRHRGKTHARMLGAILPLDVPYWTGTVPLERLRLKTIRMQRADSEDAATFTGLRRPASARLRVLQGGLS
jgi:hypothetical protein